MKNYINLRIQSAKSTAITHNMRVHDSFASRNQTKGATTANKILQRTAKGSYVLADISDSNINTILAKQKALLKEDTVAYKKAYKSRTGRNPKNRCYLFRCYYHLL